MGRRDKSGDVVWGVFLGLLAFFAVACSVGGAIWYYQHLKERAERDRYYQQQLRDE